MLVTLLMVCHESRPRLKTCNSLGVWLGTAKVGGRCGERWYDVSKLGAGFSAWHCSFHFPLNHQTILPTKLTPMFRSEGNGCSSTYLPFLQKQTDLPPTTAPHILLSGRAFGALGIGENLGN